MTASDPFRPDLRRQRRRSRARLLAQPRSALPSPSSRRPRRCGQAATPSISAAPRWRRCAAWACSMPSAGQATNMGDMCYVDASGPHAARLPAAAFSGELEIMRGDLAQSSTTPPAPAPTTSSATRSRALDPGRDRVDVTLRVRPRPRRSISSSAPTASTPTPAPKPSARSAIRPATSAWACRSSPCPTASASTHSGQPSISTRPARVDRRLQRPAATPRRRAMFYFHADARRDGLPRSAAAEAPSCTRTSPAMGWRVPRTAAPTSTRPPDFYFNSISQVHLARLVGGHASRCSAMPPAAPRRSAAWAPASPSSAPTSWRTSSAATGDHAAAFAALSAQAHALRRRQPEIRAELGRPLRPDRPLLRLDARPHHALPHPADAGRGDAEGRPRGGQLGETGRLPSTWPSEPVRVARSERCAYSPTRSISRRDSGRP